MKKEPDFGDLMVQGFEGAAVLVGSAGSAAPREREGSERKKARLQ